jgi:hypothetical protein
MALVMMVSAKREAIMIAATTVSRIRKQDVLVMIVANPIATTISPPKILRFSAKAALWFWLFGFHFGYHVCPLLVERQG